jgi:hypothetical protein
MTIFGSSKLGRAAYAVLLLLMFAFDFAKDPIANFIMAQHDQAAHQLMASRPVSFEKAAAQRQTATGKNMPLMLPSQEEMIKQITASGRKPTPEDMEKLRAATVSDAMQLALGGGSLRDDETAGLAATRSAFEMLYIFAAIAMTAITVVGLLYMVSSRIRDIGWPQYVMWLPLAPVFIPKFISIPLPPFAIQGIGVFFYAVLLTLAFVPGSGSRPSDRYPMGARPLTTIKRKPGQFGRRGTE